MCLRLSGLPEAEHKDVTNVVLDFAKSLNSTISPADIDRAHREDLTPARKKLAYGCRHIKRIRVKFIILL